MCWSVRLTTRRSLKPDVASPPGSPPPSGPARPDYEFPPLSSAERQKDLVTLVTCGTLVAADLVVSRLQAAGIQALIPDECLMQTIGFNLNTFGYVRVQVATQDYDAARDLLSGN
jgi:putative signal transducing protein